MKKNHGSGPGGADEGGDENKLIAERRAKLAELRKAEPIHWVDIPNGSGGFEDGNWRPEPKGRGRLGHGPGRLWPWPRRPGVRGVEGSGTESGGSRRVPSRGRGGRAADPSPKSVLVTKTPGTSLSLASSSDVTNT